MRIKFLMAGLFGIISVTAFAQKGELNNAKEAYDKYATFSKSAATIALGNSSIADAKTAIDKAATNTKTAELPQTYALKAAIYGALAAHDTTKATSVPLFNTSDEAYKKAKELDVKGENKALIADAAYYLAQAQLNAGVSAYQAAKYDAAYKAFDYYRQAYPEDTTAVYYTGLAAYGASKYAEANTIYTKLLTLNFSKKASIYMDLSNIALTQKDTTLALKYATEGVEKFPLNSDLRRREIEISLQTGKQQEVLAKIQSAIANDPKNKTLYYYAGLTNTMFAIGVGKELSKLKTSKDVASKNALQAKKNDFFKQATEYYKKALDIDPEYFDANLNMGYALISPAIDIFNNANQLPSNQQKEYDAAMLKASAQFELAKPYLLKATQLNPQSNDAWLNLKTYYLGTKDMAHANEVQKKIEALGGTGK